MVNVVILSASQENSLKEHAKAIGDALKKQNFKVALKNALNAQIPDVAPADIIIFGNKKYSPEKIHEDFAEIMRASKGVNFSGRIIAFFTEEDSESDRLFIKALADTGGTFYDSVLRIKNSKISSKELDTWAKVLNQFYNEFMRVRNV